MKNIFRESQKTSVTRRPSLKKNRSVDSGDHYDEVAVFYKEKHHRRRSSDHGQPGGHSRSKMSRSPESKLVQFSNLLLKHFMI